MKKFKYFLLVPIAALWACTDIVIETENGAFLNGRSMEFAIPMHTQIALYPKGAELQSKAPDGQKGLSWVSKYGYVTLNCFDEGLIADGMNEMGLSFGALWFVDVKYPKVPPSASSALVLQDIGAWLLGNFASVEEAKKGLSHIAIWAEALPSIGTPPIHVVLHDARGNDCVLEFIEGKMEVLDNPNRVLTNAPSLQWHLNNLRNYIHLSPSNANPMTLDGITLETTGQGTGLLGLPGDSELSSRFLRASFFKAFVKTPQTIQAGVNLLEHLLNTVDIPIGAVRKGKTVQPCDFTQWIVIKDMSNKVLYYRTYEDLSLRSIDLKKLNFSSQGQPASFPIDSPAHPVDMTDRLELK